jgi:hypothetical protein
MPETEEHARADQNQSWLPHLSLASPIFGATGSLQLVLGYQELPGER